jgi:hypothetical protein
MAWWRRHRDLVIGMVLGVAIGLAVIVLFVFVFSEQAVDAPSVDGSGTRTTPTATGTTPSATPAAAHRGGAQSQAPVASP